MRSRKQPKRKVMTKTVRDREKSARELAGASRRWSPKAAAELAALLEPALAEGETMPDLALVQELCGRVVEMRRRSLRDADESHNRKVTDHGELQAERSAELKNLYRELGDLRTVFRGHFGAAAANRFLGLRGETSRDPVVLPRQARLAVSRLRDRSKSLPPASFPPTSEARRGWAKSLEEKIDALHTVHQQTTFAAKQVEAASSDRQRAFDRFNEDFARLAGWLEATYRAAGLDRLADAMHPSGRRKGRLLAEVRRGSRRKTVERPAAPAERPAIEPQRPTLRLVKPPELETVPQTTGQRRPLTHSNSNHKCRSRAIRISSMRSGGSWPRRRGSRRGPCSTRPGPETGSSPRPGSKLPWRLPALVTPSDASQ